MNAPTIKLRGNRCRCAACGLYFNSADAFDRHRTGLHGISRRCQSASELLAKGWITTELGFWITGHRPGIAFKRSPFAQETRSALTPTQGAGL